MKGFIRNEGREVAFKLRKHIVQGAELDLDYAYETVGKASGLKDGLAFVKWLRERYFPEPHWGFYKEDGSVLNLGKTTSSVAGPPGKGAGKILRRDHFDGKGTDITAETIIERPFVQAKVLIDKCSDKSVLKKALTMSRHFAGKEDYMRALMRRLEQVY